MSFGFLKERKKTQVAARNRSSPNLFWQVLCSICVDPTPPIARSASESASARFSFSRGKIQAGGAARARARARPADRSRPAPARRSPPPPVDRSARAPAPARAADAGASGAPNRRAPRSRRRPRTLRAVRAPGPHRTGGKTIAVSRTRVAVRVDPSNRLWFLVFGFWFLVSFDIQGRKKDSRRQRRGRSDGHPSPLPFPSRE